jgi:triacylglycerol lipase
MDRNQSCQKPIAKQVPRSVVFAHGIWDSAETMAPVFNYIADRGFNTLALTFNPNNGSASIRDSARQLKQFTEDLLPVSSPSEDSKFALVGFSMGGLISSAFLQLEGGASRVSHFIAISAPLHGTLLAYPTFGAGCRDMRPKSELIQELAVTRDRLDGVKVTTISTPYDAMILPHTSSELECADNFKVPVLVHAWMLKDPRVHAIIHEALSY